MPIRRLGLDREDAKMHAYGMISRTAAVAAAPTPRQRGGGRLGSAIFVLIAALGGCGQLPGANPTISDETRTQVAQALEASGDPDAAAAVMRGHEKPQAAASAQDPIAQAGLLIAVGQVDQGMAIARAASAAHANDPTFALQVGRLAVMAGQLTEAADIYRQILARYPDNADAWSGTGVVLAQQGNLSGASDALRRALTLHPGDGPTRYNLALVTLLSGDIPGAVAMLELLSQTDPSAQVEATLTLARNRLQTASQVQPPP